MKKPINTHNKNLIMKLKDRYLLKKAYRIDRKRFQKSAYDLVKQPNQTNVEAQIIYHYHSLEKGLSNINFREGFGKSAYTKLMDALRVFGQLGYDKNSFAFQSGISTLQAYIKKHEKTDIDTTFMQDFINSLGDFSQIKPLGGVFNFNKEEVLKASKKDFKSVALSRFSVRDYSEEPVDESLINQALEIAKKTPSVCNRQPWHTHIIRNKDLIDKVITLQGGLRGQGHNMDTLILVTANNLYFTDYIERNQGFSDAGMYAMSLMYALHYMGLATCPLNADFHIDVDKKMRQLLNIQSYENLVMFISVGHYDKTFKSPKSPRDDIKSRTTYYH
jgi:nitroreductase